MMVMKALSNQSQNQVLQVRKYSNGQLAVFIEDKNSFPIAEISIMDDSIDLKENEFIFKDYSENTFFSEKLLNSDLIKATNRFVLIGSHLCPICKISRYV